MQAVEAIVFWLPIFYLVIINVIAFLGMWWDKRKAAKQDWRVSEVTLFILGFIGGAIGIIVGMYRFRHKTQKRSFQVITIVGLISSLIIFWFVVILYLQ
ncbi:MAG: DUF1294 domain-containing protein [Candidatus Thorarchaeota archaeon]